MLPARPAADDQIVRGLLLARLVSLGGPAPRRLGMVSLRLALATAVRMVNRVDRDSTHMTALAQPSRASGLADRNIFVVEIADLADGGAAIGLHHPLLARGQLEQRHLALFRHQLSLHTRAARELGAGARLHLDGMNDGAERDVLEHERVARLDVGVLARLDFGADLEAVGSQDVGLDAVGIVEQRDIGGAIGIVFEREDDGGNTVAVALEIDQAKAALVSAAAMTRGHAAAIVASAGALERDQQTFLGLFFGELGEIRNLHEALAGSALI